MKQVKHGWTRREDADRHTEWRPIAPGIYYIIHWGSNFEPGEVSSGIGYLTQTEYPRWIIVDHERQGFYEEQERVDSMLPPVDQGPADAIDTVHSRLIAPSQLRRSVFEQAATLGLGPIAPFVPETLLAPVVQRLQAAYGARKIAEEAGEVLGEIKRWLDYGLNLNREALLNELGDVLFAVAFSAEVQGWKLSDVADAQLRKIHRTFGAQWTKERAASLDLAKRDDSNSNGGRQ